MRDGAEVAQKCTLSEPLRYRDDYPHRAGLRWRDGGFWMQGRRRVVGCAECSPQLCSITLAISPWHSEHFPTSSRSPDRTAPEKLVIVTSWRHAPHQTLDSSRFLMSAGMAAYSLAAGGVNLGSVSTVMVASRLFDTCQHTRNRFGAERVFHGSSGLSGMRVVHNFCG